MSSRLWLVLGLVTVFGATLLVGGVPAVADETGTVRVVNDTDFTLEIRMDGTKKTTLSPGTKQTLRGIPPGSHRFQAVTDDGTIKFEKQLRLQAGQTLSWILKWTRAQGRLVIDNPGGAFVRVDIDGEPTLGVPAGGSRVYGNLDEGEHHVEVTLRRRGGDISLLSQTVTVADATPTELVVPAPRPPRGEAMPYVSSHGRPVWVRTADGWDLYFED